MIYPSLSFINPHCVGVIRCGALRLKVHRDQALILAIRMGALCLFGVIAPIFIDGLNLLVDHYSAYEHWPSENAGGDLKRLGRDCPLWQTAECGG